MDLGALICHAARKPDRRLCVTFAKEHRSDLGQIGLAEEGLTLTLSLLWSVSFALAQALSADLLLRLHSALPCLLPR